MGEPPVPSGVLTSPSFQLLVDAVVAVESTVRAMGRLGREHVLDESGQSILDEVTATHQDLPVFSGEHVFGYGTVEDTIFGIEIGRIVGGSQFVVGNGEDRLDVTVLRETDHTGYERDVGRNT